MTDPTTPADPERRSVTVETLATILPGLLPQHGDPPRQFWLDTARAILAALSQDATPAGREQEAYAAGRLVGFEEGLNAAPSFAADLAATDPEGIASAGGPVHSEHSE